MLHYTRKLIIVYRYNEEKPMIIRNALISFISTKIISLQQHHPFNIVSLLLNVFVWNFMFSEKIFGKMFSEMFSINNNSFIFLYFMLFNNILLLVTTFFFVNRNVIQRELHYSIVVRIRRIGRVLKRLRRNWWD